MLDRNYGSASLAELGFGGESEIGSGRQGYHRSDWGSVGIFMMTERAVVQDPVHLLKFADGSILEVDVRPMHPFGEFGGIIVHVFQIILTQSNKISKNS